MRDYRYTTPHGIQVTRTASTANFRKGLKHILRAVEEVRKLAAGKIIAGGHSYGGRQTATAAADHPEMAAGLLLLSYPLHPPDKPQQLRTSFFPQLRTPALFVSGSRDPFGTVEELREALRLIPGKTDLLIVERAGHDLKGAAGMAGTILERMLF